MDTFGPRTRAPARPVKRFAQVARDTLAWVAAGSIPLFAGCATSIQLGQTPRTERLAELKPGASSMEEIRRVLGEPAGRGAGRLPNFPPQDIWMYESMKTDGKDSHAHMLLVFVSRNKGIYEGHIWFRSDRALEKVQK